MRPRWINGWTDGQTNEERLNYMLLQALRISSEELRLGTSTVDLVFSNLSNLNRYLRYLGLLSEKLRGLSRVPKKGAVDCNAFMCCICWPTAMSLSSPSRICSTPSSSPDTFQTQRCSAGCKCEKLCATDGRRHAHFPSACFLPLLILKRKIPAKGKRLVGLKEFWNKNVCFLLLYWLSLLPMEFRSSGNFSFYFDTKVSPSLISFPFSLPLIASYWWE